MLKRSLRNSFLRIASLICLPILCVGTLVFYFSFTTLVKETQNRINASCHLMEQSLTNVFREVNKQKSLFEGNSILYLTILQLLNNETLTYEQARAKCLDIQSRPMEDFRFVSSVRRNPEEYKGYGNIKVVASNIPTSASPKERVKHIKEESRKWITSNIKDHAQRDQPSAPLSARPDRRGADREDRA